MINFVPQPEGAIRLGDFLMSHLRQEEWTEFRAAVAFVKHSGVRHIREALNQFSHHATVKISVGIDFGSTSVEGLRDLLESIDNRGEVWVFHNENNSTFHPKVYLFRSQTRAVVLVGSGNLTEGGLFTNYEASLAVSLDLNLEPDRDLLERIQNTLDEWSHLAQGTARQLTPVLLEQLVAAGYIVTEIQAREIEEATPRPRREVIQGELPVLFERRPVPRAPQVPPPIPDEPEDLTEEDFEVEVPPPVPTQPGRFTGFVMTLQRTDVGRGQTTPGTAPRSPEIFIPLSARNHDPEFWGWPDSFTPDPDPRTPGKMDRMRVPIRIGPSIVHMNMMTWPVKHDFRLRSEELRSAGNVGDILRIERTDGQGGFAYYVEIIPPGTSQYAHYLALCVNPVRNSLKRWGYY